MVQKSNVPILFYSPNLFRIKKNKPTIVNEKMTGSLQITRYVFECMC